MKNNKRFKKIRRRLRIRATIKGTAKRPRLSVFRSLRQMNLQLVDDENSKTLVSVNSKTAKLKGDAGDRKAKVAESFLLGKELAEKAKEMKIEEIVFDRGGNLYHGKVAAAAEGAREGGLKF